ncbi:MAG: TonB-dependent receptor [Reichenbachiella sp.]
MNKKYFLLLLLTLILISESIAQQSVTLKGKVVDEINRSPLEYSSVALYTLGENKLLDGSITNDKGEFQLQIKPGEYILKVKYISYLDKNIKVTVSLNEKIKDLGNIGLQIKSTELDEVVVTSQKDQFEFSLDKRTFNVGENVSNLGKNAAEILDNIPSVQVDIEGEVSLRGNNNINILVDGKPSGLVGISNQDALRQLQGTMIERIEVITNPSARYDAEGSGGIINIVLKKDARKGVNGSFNVNIGYPANLNGSVNMNYRSGKFNFFVSGGIQYREREGMGYSYQTFTTPGFEYNTERNRDQSRSGLSENFRFGSDYFFNEKSILTLSVLLKNSDENNESNVYYNDYDINGIISNQEHRLDNETEDEGNIEFALNYKKEFERKDHSLTFFSQYRDNGEVEQSDVTHHYLTLDTDTAQQVYNDESENNLLLQIDYVHPFGINGKFESGLKSNFRRIGNDYQVSQLNANGWELIPAFSSDFEYDEDIHAVYGIYGNKTGKVSYQLGLRTEITDIKTRLITTGEHNSKFYYNVFPSAHLTYSFKKDRDLQASYSRRMKRPRFRSLNPFSSFSDNRNIRTGNPDLDPELSDALEVGYLASWESASVYGGVYYNYTTDVIQRISQYVITETDSIIVSQPQNLASRNSYGLELTFSKEIDKWLKLNGSFNFYRSLTEGSVLFGERMTSLEADARSWSARANSTFTLPKNLDLQLNFNYRGPQNTTQGKSLSYYTIDLGASKQIMKKKGTLTLSVQDVFNTRKYRWETETESFVEYSEYQRNTRQILLSFMYRLNQKDKGRRNGQKGRQRAPGASDEGVDF